MHLSQRIPNFSATDRLIRHLAPKGYFVGFNSVKSTWRVLYSTYNQKWQDAYCLGRYHIIDPVEHWITLHEGTQRWSEIMDVSVWAEGINVMEERKQHGLNYGIVIGRQSLAGGHRKSIFTAGRDDREFTEEEISVLNKTFIEMAEYVEPSVTLNEGEKRALECCGCGLTQKQSASELDVSIITVNRHLASAREKLGANTTTQAVLIAHECGLIDLSHQLVPKVCSQ